MVWICNIQCLKIIVSLNVLVLTEGKKYVQSTASHALTDLTTAWYCSYSSDSCLKYLLKLFKTSNKALTKPSQWRRKHSLAHLTTNLTGLFRSCWVWTQMASLCVCCCWNCEPVFTQQSTWYDSFICLKENHRRDSAEVSRHVLGTDDFHYQLVKFLLCRYDFQFWLVSARYNFSQFSQWKKHPKLFKKKAVSSVRVWSSETESFLVTFLDS